MQGKGGFGVCHAFHEVPSGDGGVRPCQMAVENPKGILSQAFYMKHFGIIPLGSKEGSAVAERDTSRMKVSCERRGPLRI